MHWVIGRDMSVVPQGERQNMSREDSLSFVVTTFRSLEEQLISCMEYIPYLDQNLQVASPRLVPLLMDACSLIESIFRHTQGNTQRGGLRSYATILEGRLGLEEATTLLLISPMKLLRPFAGWTSSVPPWWDAYNRLKHDRIQNSNAATLGYSVAALAGLHQVLARSREFFGNLAAAGWFNWNDAEHLMELFTMRDVGVANPPEMPVETKLFVSSTIGSFVDWNSPAPTVDEHGWNFSSRVILFFTEIEDRF